MSKKLVTQPRGASSRRVDNLEKTQRIVLGRTDSDRHKLVSKTIKGALRRCKECQAMSDSKRWLSAEQAAAVFPRAASPVELTLCPGCQRVKEGRVDGWVRLEGPVVSQQKAEIRHLVDRILDRAIYDDPVHRIISYQQTGDILTLETTSAWLAETLGKAIRDAYHGSLNLHFIPDEEFVRVYWHQ